jgi:hypothetical protein
MVVLAFRMSNGDEILGRFDESQQPMNAPNVTVLTKVRHLVVQRTAEGLATVLMPWAFSNIDGPVTISNSHIMARITPSPDSVVPYQEQTTGIALASA